MSKRATDLNFMIINFTRRNHKMLTQWGKNPLYHTGVDPKMMAFDMEQIGKGLDRLSRDCE